MEKPIVETRSSTENFESPIEYETLYKWIDNYDISRPKKNIARDFSDGVPLAEILKHHFPHIIDLPNVSPGSAFYHKMNNWKFLEDRVLKKLNVHLSPEIREQLAKAMPGVIDNILWNVRRGIVESFGPEAVEDFSYPYDGDTYRIPAYLLLKIHNDIIDNDRALSILRHKVRILENVLETRRRRK